MTTVNVFLAYDEEAHEWFVDAVDTTDGKVLDTLYEELKVTQAKSAGDLVRFVSQELKEKGYEPHFPALR